MGRVTENVSTDNSDIRLAVVFDFIVRVVFLSELSFVCCQHVTIKLSLQGLKLIL